MRATFARSEKAFRSAIAPDTLSQLVLRVLTTPNPKPRYLIGRESVGLAFLALLPARQRAKLVSRVSRTGT